MPKIGSWLLLFLLCLFVKSPALAEYCLETGQTCVEGAATRNIEGFDIYKDCWKYEVSYKCYTDNHSDYCKVVNATPGCEIIDSTCEMPGQDNICNKLKQTYKCGNLLKETLGSVLLDSQYTITRDELDKRACNPLDSSNDCYEVSKTCVEGAETRNINGKDIYKDCWRYESKYSCFNASRISDCEEYDKECHFVSQKCLSDNKEGKCRHIEKRYLCGELLGKQPMLLSCQNAKYCIGGDCEEISYQPNKNMGQAISSLSAISNLKDDLDIESCKTGDSKTCKIFNGQLKHCRINPLSSRNCCRDKGWLKDLRLAECNETEKLLGESKERGLCHEVGTYCSKKLKPTKVCIEKKRSYCCFQSRLARIIHEQGRTQIGIGWGSPESPNCQPLSVKQLQQIDFSKIDFREFYGDMNNKLNSGKQGFTPLLHKKVTPFTQQDKANNHGDDVLDSSYREEIQRRIKQHYGN